MSERKEIWWTGEEGAGIWTEVEIENGHTERRIASLGLRSNGDKPTRLHRARLMSAAPELAEALAALMEFWDNGSPVHPGAEIVEDARAALRKAGRLP